MMNIIAKNPLFFSTLAEALKEFNPEPFTTAAECKDICVVFDTQEAVDKLLKNPLSCAVVLIGTRHEEADLELPAPCLLADLKAHIKTLLSSRQNAPVFENKRFLFDGVGRSLRNKKTKQEFRLTEKETDMIIYLVKSLPEGASKTDLLTGVWKYRADIETHTVETHIYALRQKIGEDDADNFIKNTPDGYILVTP